MFNMQALVGLLKPFCSLQGGCRQFRVSSRQTYVFEIRREGRLHTTQAVPSQPHRVGSPNNEVSYNACSWIERMLVDSGLKAKILNDFTGPSMIVKPGCSAVSSRAPVWLPILVRATSQERVGPGRRQPHFQFRVSTAQSSKYMLLCAYQAGDCLWAFDGELPRSHLNITPGGKNDTEASRLHPTVPGRDSTRELLKQKLHGRIASWYAESPHLISECQARLPVGIPHQLEYFGIQRYADMVLNPQGGRLYFPRGSSLVYDFIEESATGLQKSVQCKTVWPSTGSSAGFGASLCRFSGHRRVRVPFLAGDADIFLFLLFAHGHTPQDRDLLGYWYIPENDMLLRGLLGSTQLTCQLHLPRGMSTTIGRLAGNDRASSRANTKWSWTEGYFHLTGAGEELHSRVERRSVGPDRDDHFDRLGL